MKFLLMIHGDEGGWDDLPEADQAARRAEYVAVAERGDVLHAAELAPTSTATTVRVQDASTLVTDGPYAEAREALGGLFVVEAASIDDALDVARALPAPRGRGGIEVRPVYGGES
jgi:hypothetical protein